MLITEQEEAERSALLQHAKASGIGELNVPKKILSVRQLPLLGTGKIDYPAVKTMAEENFGEGVAA